MKAPLPGNETERLRMLELYHILDTAEEAAFDDITRLGAIVCDTPICLISLIDDKRQWFKSRVGLSATETSRDIAFCAHAILQDDVFEVEDALLDQRFAENPLVTSAPHIRFYSGAPLTVASGIALGTLCVIDHEPRQLTTQQTEGLKILRQMVVTQLELRRALGDLQLLNQMLPMCAWCRSIRDDSGAWQPLDKYVAGAFSVTHGICPQCSKALHPGLPK